jgi:hypothetical protein
MESVSDLPRLRCAGARALRVKTAAIAADDFYLWVLTKPFGYPGGRTVLQQIDNLAPLQIDDDGPICAALSPTPVVDTCHPYRRRPPAGDLPLQMPKNGVVADRHAKAFHQPLARPATRPMTKKMKKLGGSVGSATVRTNNPRQPIRKCQTWAFPVQTSPAARLYSHRHGGALCRKVLKMSDISAVPRPRLLATFRTDAVPGPAAEITQRSPFLSTPRIRTPGPGAQSVLFRIPSGYR